MELREIMEAFAGETGISGIEADENGAYHFSIDEIGVMFETDETGARLGMFAEVGELPAEGREVVYRAMLESMSTSDGLVLSIPHGTDRVVLSRADPLESTDYAAFKNRLEGLVNAAEGWRRNIADFPALYNQLGDAAKVADEESRKFGENGFLQV